MTETRIVKFVLPSDFGHEDVAVTKLENGRFRLEDDPLWWLFADDADSRDLPSYRDEIEAEEVESGVLLFRRVARRASYRTYLWVLAREFLEAPVFSEFSSEIESEDGLWVRVFEGILIVHIPESSTYDPQRRLRDFLCGLADA